MMDHSHHHQLLPPTLPQYGEGSRDHGRKTRDAGSWWRAEQPLVFAQIPSSAARHDGETGETAEIVSSVIDNQTKIITYASCVPKHYEWEVYPSGRLMLGTDNDPFVHEYRYGIL